MDKVFIKGLRVDAVIGVYDWERDIRQRLLLDIDMATDIKRAAETDDVAHTLDYDRISRRVEAYVSESKFQLIETLAEKVAALVIDEFAVTRVVLSVHKPGAVDIADDVGVCIERSA